MMLSHAQNFEDVMLARALKSVARGFYIDVGARDPDLDSVTRHFYEAGWSGVNIEPNPNYLTKLKARRPRDVNLGLAVGAEEGAIEFTIIHGTGMSTTKSRVAAMHAGRAEQQEKIRAEVKPLNDIFAAHAPQAVHFLKIDCEGAEADVINAFDLTRYRPWIVLVEATEPLTSVPNHESWEPHLLNGGYEFVYFDGLNRFYVAREQEFLRKHFGVPPNIFDDFMVARMVDAGRDAAPKLPQSFMGRLRAVFSGYSGD